MNRTERFKTLKTQIKSRYWWNGLELDWGSLLKSFFRFDLPFSIDYPSSWRRQRLKPSAVVDFQVSERCWNVFCISTLLSSSILLHFLLYSSWGEHEEHVLVVESNQGPPDTGSRLGFSWRFCLPLPSVFLYFMHSALRNVDCEITCSCQSADHCGQANIVIRSLSREGWNTIDCILHSHLIFIHIRSPTCLCKHILDCTLRWTLRMNAPWTWDNI